MKQRYFSFLLVFLSVSLFPALAQEGKHRVFDVWEVAYGAGSPFGLAEHRTLSGIEFTQKFTQMGQVSFMHQFKGRELGAATEGYRYPAIGAYVKWLDYSRLSFRGDGKQHGQICIPKEEHFDYGHIGSVGWVLDQYTWNKGRWRGHLHLENGAAYVFHPIYAYNGYAVTLAKPWQIFIGCGYYFDYQVCNDGELALGTQFNHMSNSGMSDYNTGINTFSLSLRYRHTARPVVERCKKEDALTNRDGTLFKKHLYSSITTGMGSLYSDNFRHSTGMLAVSADAMVRLSPTHGMGLGLDFWHQAQADRMGRNDYVGLSYKYDHWWGSFAFHGHIGAYLNGKRPIKYKSLSRIYQQLGFKYLFLRDSRIAPYLGIYSKANGFNAEAMTFAVGAVVK